MAKNTEGKSIKCPNCGSTNMIYSIPDWEYDPERGNYCADPGWFECIDCLFNTGKKNTEGEIMEAIQKMRK